MQYWSCYFESNGPFRPQAAKEPHDDYCFDGSADKGREEGSAEDFNKKSVSSDMHPVQDYSHMRPEFGKNIEGSFGWR